MAKIDAGNALSSAAKGAATGAAAGPWGAVAGAVVGLGSSILGSVSSANKNRKARQLIQTQRDENKNWYDMRMAQDYTQRSDSQAILSRQRELLNEQYKNARATNIVAGGSDESLALQKQAANESMATTMNNLAGSAASYKERVEDQYRQTDAQLNQQQAADYQRQANNVAQAASQGVVAGLNLMASGMGQNGTTTTTQTQTVQHPGQQMLQNDINNSKPQIATPTIPKAKDINKINA